MSPQQPSSSRAAGPRNVNADRRTRLRLRELCDEVSASWRAAAGHELFTDADRSEARALIGRLAPLPRA